MPRSKKPRNSSAQRWSRRKTAKEHDGTLAGISQRIACESLEFASLFLVAGGRAKIGPEIIVRAYDLHGRRIRGRGIVPAILSVERDKASKLMAKAKDAIAIQERKESLRLKRGLKQDEKILRTFDSGVLGFCNVNSDLIAGQQRKSILVGSSDLDSPPMAEWSNMVVCFRGDDGRYYVGEESFDGTETSLDLLVEDGEPITYPSQEAAHRSTLTAIETGEIERLVDHITPPTTARLKRSLIVWKSGEQANAMFESYTPAVEVSDQRQRISTPVKRIEDATTGELYIADRVRPRDAADSQYSVRVGKKRSLRVQPLAEIQLAQNRADSE